MSQFTAGHEIESEVRVVKKEKKKRKKEDSHLAFDLVTRRDLVH